MRLNDGRVRLLHERYEAGATLQELAEEFRINRDTAMQHVKRAGLRPRWRILSSDDVAKAAMMYSSGRFLATVGDSFRRRHRHDPTSIPTFWRSDPTPKRVDILEKEDPGELVLNQVAAILFSSAQLPHRLATLTFYSMISHNILVRGDRAVAGR
jgi:hypothetical protein